MYELVVSSEMCFCFVCFVAFFISFGKVKKKRNNNLQVVPSSSKTQQNKNTQEKTNN